MPSGALTLILDPFLHLPPLFRVKHRSALVVDGERQYCLSGAERSPQPSCSAQVFCWVVNTWSNRGALQLGERKIKRENSWHLTDVALARESEHLAHCEL